MKTTSKTYDIPEKWDIREIRGYMEFWNSRDETCENLGAHIRRLLRHSYHYNCDIRSIKTARFVAL